jgi:hypothetical protein
MENIKYTDLLDFVILTLRNVRQQKPNFFVSLVALLKIFNYSVSFAEIQEMAKYFETRGWVNSIYILGDVRVQITTAGLIYIEEKESSINEKYNICIKELKKEKSDKDFFVEIFTEQEINEAKKPIYDLIDKVIEKIKDKISDPDYQKDLEIIKVEASKNMPDLRLIAIKLNRLTPISVISKEISELKSYFNPPDTDFYN